jgi:hypothetical protein|tara:strand:- start:1419 stop:1589 length:171 start_codon:yes stop_codon:yes gene_type:complete
MLDEAIETIPHRDDMPERPYSTALEQYAKLSTHTQVQESTINLEEQRALVRCLSEF